MKFKFYAALLLACTLSAARAQTIPSPKQHFGFTIGTDYKLANFTQTEAYFKKLSASPRTRYVDIGLTEEGRHQFMLIVSSPANLKQLDKYKRISQQLAHAENLTDAQARALAAQGKAIVWIDGGLHANETVGIHQLIETAYQLVSRNDAEVKHILDNTIILLVHANPDGQELISNWYMQEKDSTKRNMNIPRLYEKYIGHDNNRDFFMMNMKETRNITRQQYIEWLPQIVYNHHQTGPAGSVVAGPPYRDPFNYLYDPLLVTSIDAVGAAMNNRMNAENKPGYTQRAGTSFSTWWNGGLRTAPYFHNMVGLLTEIIGNPTPSNIPLVPERLIPNGATPNPITPQPWHFKQSIDYSVSLNYAVLNYAANQRQDMLFNIYRMGKNSIERGSRDNWTLSPKKIDSIYNLAKVDVERAGTPGPSPTIEIRRGGNLPVKYYNQVLKDSTLRDARGYIISANQTDFPTAVKFINALIRSGIVVQQATGSFNVGGKSYPAGSYIVKTNQAFRPHVLDMFEPQDHPNDFQYPGGPPVRPYDITGWTLAYQMGVKFDRVLGDFNGPFKRIQYGQLQHPPLIAVVPSATKTTGYLLSAHTNESFTIVNDMLNRGESVYRLPNGTFYINRSYVSQKITSAIVGIRAVEEPPSDMLKIKPARIALLDVYGGSIPTGWVKWIMEQYQFPYQIIYPQDVDAGDLKSKYDVIVFASGTIPAAGNRRTGGGEAGNRNNTIPAEYQRMTGRITAEKSIPQLKNFLEAGGHIVTIGTSANLAYQLNLPVKSALTETTSGGQTRPLPEEKFYIPGSILQANVDTSQPANWGMDSLVDVDYDTSPVFKLDANATKKGVTPLMIFNSAKPLRSGWAWGQQYLNNTVAAFEAKVGSGKLIVFGPEITFRGQAQGTFKLLFNQLYNYQ